jgi:hypothetical protein
MPVVKIDGVRVGSGVPGPVSMALYQTLAARLEGAPAAAGAR